MGQDVSGEQAGPEAVRAFTRALLRDLQALEQMLERGTFESGVRRIGVEQEMFLVNRGWRPAPVSLEVLDRLSGPYTTELGLFNLEANVEPRVLEGRCFSQIEDRMNELVEGARRAAEPSGADVALVGILPTLSKSDLSLENITPRARYYALNEALSKMRGGEPYKLRIEGTDELYIEHESVMLEACNTSCQVHLQVEADDFAHVYNVAQVVTAPALAASVNSPVLFAKRLWDETRIALFQQSVDTRSATVHMRELSPRVRFGEQWVRESVTELFQEDVARFRVLLTSKVDEDPIERLKSGQIPELRALQLHNSTIYRWNRPCYGVGSNGRPHLRIECRVLPSGPTIVDEVANAAFWIGLVTGGSDAFGDVTARIGFDEVKENFLAASRHGLKAGFHWLDGTTYSASRLILDELIPLARAGLAGAGVDPEDIDRYLGIVHERVESGNTGSQWMMRSFTAMRDQGTRAERLAAVTGALVRRQREGSPVHSWEVADLHEAGGWRLNYLRVEQYMTTQLFTVHEDELVDMVAFLMDRKTIRHVLVEDDQHRLVGIVSYRSLIRLMAEDFDRREEAPPVRAIMERDPISVAPETPTLEAIDLMRRHRVSCLPVVKHGKLVGIVSERDFMPIAYELLEEKLRQE
jgi:CBS domain-containing protein/gamma-glutamylcysteine synthetase